MLTDSEEVDKIEEQLNEQLGEFDGMMLRKREQVKTEENEQGGSAGSYGGDALGSNESGETEAEQQENLIDNNESKAVTVGQQPVGNGDGREGEFEFETNATIIRTTK